MNEHDFDRRVFLKRSLGCAAVTGLDEATIAYDYGFGGPGALAEGSATRIKIVSLDRLYGRV